MSKKPPITNTKSTTYTDKKIKNTKKLEKPEQKNKEIHIPTKHNQSLRGSSFNSYSTASPADILHKRNALINLHMEKQEAIHTEEVLYQSSAEPLATSNKHKETQSIICSKKGFLCISNITKYIASIMKLIKTEDIQSHATDSSKKYDLKFTNIPLSLEDPSNIMSLKQIRCMFTPNLKNLRKLTTSNPPQNIMQHYHQTKSIHLLSLLQKPIHTQNRSTFPSHHPN